MGKQQPDNYWSQIQGDSHSLNLKVGSFKLFKYQLHSFRCLKISKAYTHLQSADTHLSLTTVPSRPINQRFIPKVFLSLTKKQSLSKLRFFEYKYLPPKKELVKCLHSQGTLDQGLAICTVHTFGIHSHSTSKLVTFTGTL